MPKVMAMRLVVVRLLEDVGAEIRVLGGIGGWRDRGAEVPSWRVGLEVGGLVCGTWLTVVGRHIARETFSWDIGLCW